VRWRAEMLGLAAASLEAALADLPEVIPVVEGAPQSPGLADALQAGRERWTAALQIGQVADGVRFAIRLCDANEVCTDLAADAQRERPEPALARLLEGIAGALGRAPPEAIAASWAAPISQDPYAILLAGRSAATWYGLLPGVREDEIGDRRRDPITRAVLVDPQLALAQWINGRRSLARGAPQLARSAFTRASLAAPQRLLFRADEAAAVGAMGLEEEARRAWELVQARAPDEIRFAAARARALVEAGDLAGAAELLDGLPDRFDGDVAAIEIRVALAERGGPAPPYDGLLARWQLADGADPEPVRRRIDLRVREGRYDEAIAFLPALEERGAAEEAARLAISLGIAVGDYDLASRKAEELGLTHVAARVRARAKLLLHPDEVPPELLRPDEPVEFVARGGVHLRAGRPALALADAEAALARSPWLPEALALRVESLRALGRDADAARAARLLRHADPAWPLDGRLPGGAPRVQVQAQRD